MTATEISFFDASDADDCEDDTLDDRDDANDVDAKTANHLEASSVSLRDAFPGWSDLQL